MNDYNTTNGLIGTARQQESSELIGKSYSPTLAENIEQRIAMLHDHIQRLEKVKENLQQRGCLLDIPIEDLRFVMNY